MRKVKLKDVADVIISNVDKKSTVGQKVVHLCNFTNVYYNWAITNHIYKDLMVATASDLEIQKFKVCKGQVAITKDSETRDDIGIATYIADDMPDVVLGYHCALITPHENEIEGSFLNAYLNSYTCKKYFANNASGSGQRYTLSLDTLRDIQIFLPDIEEQRRIGNLFSYIDEKITLNKEINDKLEQTARKLYDYWFLQFDFPAPAGSVDANGKPIPEGAPYRSSGGAMTYNDKLKREIPVGWRNGYLIDIVNECGTVTNKNKITPNLYYTPIDKLPSHRMCFNEYAPFEEAQSSLQTYQKYNILLGSMRVYFHKVCIAPFDGITRSTAIVMNPKLDDNLGYAYQVINEEHFIKKATVYSNGSQQPMIGWNDIKKFDVVVPPATLMLKYSQHIKNNIEQVINIELLNMRLCVLRNKLLPLLMNGQVTINK